jgi:hypothetical protein
MGRGFEFLVSDRLVVWLSTEESEGLHIRTPSLGLGRGLWRNIWGISIKGGICALD